MLRLEQLRIHRPCPGDAQIDRASSYCHTCSKSVHELSEMTPPEVEALLEQSVGNELCVSYRVNGMGRPVFRADPAPRRMPAVVMTLALAACTPWGLEAPEAETPGQGGECVLVEEGVWECVDDFAIAEREEVPTGCQGSEVDGEWEGISRTVGTMAAPMVAEVPTPLPEEAAAVGQVVTVDFEIDPDEGHLRGMLVQLEPAVGARLQYTPTAELYEAWKGRHARRKRERELRRKRRRRLRVLAKSDDN
jgi:hypothetical protein